MLYFIGKINLLNGVYILMIVKVGIVYDMKSIDIFVFINDSLEVYDIEVYKVDGEYIISIIFWYLFKILCYFLFLLIRKL